MRIVVLIVLAFRFFISCFYWFLYVLITSNEHNDVRLLVFSCCNLADCLFVLCSRFHALIMPL